MAYNRTRKQGADQSADGAKNPAAGQNQDQNPALIQFIRALQAHNRQARSTSEAVGMGVRKFLFEPLMQGLMSEIYSKIYNRNERKRAEEEGTPNPSDAFYNAKWENDAQYWGTPYRERNFDWRQSLRDGIFGGAQTTPTAQTPTAETPSPLRQAVQDAVIGKNSAENSPISVPAELYTGENLAAYGKNLSQNPFATQPQDFDSRTALRQGVLGTPPEGTPVTNPFEYENFAANFPSTEEMKKLVEAYLSQQRGG